ncbi:MAG: hypothetical protein KME40_26195 [Komarekiella atlantica HA4396-MV6]|jgi:hypothetical protein|nr:hypothetical protein [Komarekiella atlantica HA4396-MV6]
MRRRSPWSRREARRSEKSSQCEQSRLRRKRKVRAALGAVDAHQKACRRHLSFVREATGVGAAVSAVRDSGSDAGASLFKADIASISI